MYKGYVNEICFKVCLRGTNKVFECTQPIYIACEFATKNHQTFLSIYIYVNDFQKLRVLGVEASRVVYLTNYLMIQKLFLICLCTIKQKVIRHFDNFCYMENSKFTESVFQGMKYNLQGRPSRFLTLIHKIVLKWPKVIRLKWDCQIWRGVGIDMSLQPHCWLQFELFCLRYLLSISQFQISICICIYIQ